MVPVILNEINNLIQETEQLIDEGILDFFKKPTPIFRNGRRYASEEIYRKMQNATKSSLVDTKDSYGVRRSNDFAFANNGVK